ncbi:AbrB family transcriptional regulator [Telmatospirillum sp. J64-1]|uniref:AbrB family transcriptional regulator n=1 Tax=Telmatospirillum sp. J64-1 TaxID=2502183 RepID=UPI00115DBC0A|nr:AbrB family transcriptional regulator [Telmatospirillum sp. J64-1]
MPLVLSNSLRLMLSLALGLAGGWVAYQLHLPLPWLLGALAVTMLPSMAGVKLRGPKRLRSGVLAVIGLFLGGGFTPEIIDQLGLWLVSLGGMLAATVVMGAFGVWYSHRIAGFDRATAWAAGLPGGLSAMTVLAPSLGADVRLVALTHGMRLVTVLVGVPLAVDLVLGIDLAEGNLPEPWAASPETGLTLVEMAFFAGCLVLGVPLARLLRFPTPSFTGPMALSAVLHITGTLHAMPPSWLLVIAQVVIGVSVGVGFKGFPFLRLVRTLITAAGQSVGFLVIGIASAVLMHEVTGLPLAPMMLAYVPGGAAEMGIVALALGLDPAFVAVHHLSRLVIILMCMPLLIQWLLKPRPGKEKNALPPMGQP